MSSSTGMSEELELLERVLLRLGCADTDEQLQVAVGKFLAPVLLKITSPHEAVRLKVMEVLTHVNKRLKSRPLVHIPIEPILQQYQESSSSFAINFSIIYITMGFPRLDTAKQTELAPLLLNCLEGKPEMHQDKLLMLVLPLLSNIKFPDDVEQRKTMLGLSDKPSTKKQFISLLEDVLLLPYGITQDAEIPPGMSPYSFKRVVANAWKAEELENLKKGIVRFLCSGVFVEMDLVSPLIIASADTRFSVATPALVEVNKFSATLDWTNPATSAPLYGLFCGNGSKIPDRKTTSGSARVRQKLLQYLLKCHGPGINVPKGIQVIFEALFGENTNRKCKVLALQFADNLIKDGPRELIEKLSKVLLSGFAKLVGSSEDVEVQTAAYMAISQLARVCPNIFNRDLQIVEAYFKELSECPIELQTPIREALLAIAPAFSWKHNSDKMDVDDADDFKLSSNQHLLLALLSDHAESKLTVVQNTVSFFLTTCFPETYVTCRYLLLVIAGNTPQLRESITTYLYGSSRKEHIDYSRLTTPARNTTDTIENTKGKQPKIILPDFKALVNHIYEVAQKRVTNPQHNFTTGKVTLAYNYETYTEILEYLRICFWYSAGASKPGSEKENHLVHDYLLKNYDPKDDDNEIKKYLQLIKNLVRARCSLIELSCLLDLLNVMPMKLAEINMDLMDKFVESLKEVSEDIRTLVGELFGILLAYGKSDAEFNSEITDMLAKSPQKSLEHKHGSFIAIANAFYRKIRIMKASNQFSQDKIQNWPELKHTLDVIVSLLFTTQNPLIAAGVKGIMLIGTVTELPYPDGGEIPASSSTESKMDVDETPADNTTTKLSIMKGILKLLSNSSIKNKLREEAAHCLGFLAVGDKNFFIPVILELFLRLTKLTKDPSINIAMGQAIVYTLQGDVNAFNYDENTVACGNASDEVFEDFLRKIIRQVPSTHTYSRQTCAIWLLSLVKHCSNRQPILKNRSLIQMAFTDLVMEDNDLIQDVASRGLGIVFSLASTEVQNELATNLLELLTGGRKQVKQVDEDSKLFEDGVLGKTPSGENITTYKELCSLASDLNQPDLIYQFMELANHNSVWNSKLGAAFGLSSIGKVAKVKIEPYLKKIVPRLFRYKYDPTPKIQNSMISIWDSIITDTNETIELYYWNILEELTKNMTAIEWRVRIACCLGVRDLLKRPGGLKLRSDDKQNEVNIQETNKMDVDEEVVPEPDLLELWKQTFRVMDDIHEGTRLAAEGTCKQLSKISVIAASSDHGKSANNITASILPFLLNVGVTNTVEEIRQLSIKTISELIDSSGKMITPHLEILVPNLLRATGELESVKLSYLSTRHAADTDTQEVIDSVRAEAAKSHHCTETLSKCIKYINYEEFEKMTPAILDVIKTSLSLGSKTVTAHFLCSVCSRLGQSIQPLCPKYTKACLTQLTNRNGVVRKYYANAIGHLLGYAKEKTVINCFNQLEQLYFEQQSNRAIPQVINAANKRHTEILKDYAEKILPLMFFAMHEEITEENRSTVELWKELWIEISPGDAGIRMNLDPILVILEKSIGDASWLLKAQSASSIATVAKKLGKNLDDANRKRLIQLILNNISGRTFKGKERYLEALAKLNSNLNTEETELSVKIVDAAMREARKEEPVYRTHALKALGEILDDSKIDRFEEVYNMLWYLLDKHELNENAEKTVTADEKNQRAAIFVALKESVCSTLGKAWPTNSLETQEKYQKLFVEKCVECLKNNTRQVQLSLLSALGNYLERLQLFGKFNFVDSESDEPTNREKKIKIDDEKFVELDHICASVLSIVASLSEIPHTGIKKESLDIVLILIKRLKENHNRIIMEKVETTFENILPALQKDNSPEVRCRIKDIQEKLKQK